MIIIIAKFIGTDSLGYIMGQTYKLKIVENSITREDGSGFCPYSSIEYFLKNWTLISIWGIK